MLPTPPSAIAPGLSVRHSRGVYAAHVHAQAAIRHGDRRAAMMDR